MPDYGAVKMHLCDAIAKASELVHTGISQNGRIKNIHGTLTSGLDIAFSDRMPFRD